MISTLLIQINCFNEAESLPITLNDLPKKIPGVKKIEVLVVDDGSTDDTAEIAKLNGVKHIVRHNGNRGLPKSVNSGMFYAIQIGADALVNTDADNQYVGSQIIQLVQPIIQQKADVVYGQRKIKQIEHFSFFKKNMQALGAKVVSFLAGKKITDAASGFRALSKDAILKLYLLSDFASPLETLAQVRRKKLALHVIDVDTNSPIRPSRLFKSEIGYIWRSFWVILDNMCLNFPTLVFGTLGSICIFLGLVLMFVRSLLFYSTEAITPLRINLAIFAVMFLVVGLQVLLFTLILRLNKHFRDLQEENLYRQNILILKASKTK